MFVANIDEKSQHCMKCQHLAATGQAQPLAGYVIARRLSMFRSGPAPGGIFDSEAIYPHHTLHDTLATHSQLVHDMDLNLF